jgi:hypothetical protein
MSSVNVHVVAWRFDGGGGFYWYPTPKAADEAFKIEQENEGGADNWKAYRFDASVGSLETATEEIEQTCDDACDRIDASKAA